MSSASLGQFSFISVIIVWFFKKYLSLDNKNYGYSTHSLYRAFSLLRMREEQIVIKN